MRSEPLLCASNRQSDQHRFSFVNISDAVIEFDEIMADGEICIQMCCGFSFMVFWIEIIYMYENVTWWLAHFARINPLFYEVELPKKFFFRFRDSYHEWARWNALRMTRTHCSYLLSLSRMYKCDVYASCIWIMLFFYILMLFLVIANPKTVIQSHKIPWFCAKNPRNLFHNGAHIVCFGHNHNTVMSMWILSKFSAITAFTNKHKTTKL